MPLSPPPRGPATATRRDATASHRDATASPRDATASHRDATASHRDATAPRPAAAASRPAAAASPRVVPGVLALGVLLGCGRTDMTWALRDVGDSSSTGDATGSTNATGSTDATDPFDSADTTLGPPLDTTDATDTIDPTDTDSTGPIPDACGNWQLDPGEECDPGQPEIGPTQACVPGCQLNVCGDGMPGPAEACDDGNDDPSDACNQACAASFCGDGIVWTGQEDCDDADLDDIDACHDDCTRTRGLQIALGGNHSCALLTRGVARCWGNGNNGRTGQGSLENFGDDEPAGAAAGLSTPQGIVDLVAGLSHTCVLLGTGDVACFGRAAEGQLGYGNTNDIGDDELPFAAGMVDLPEPSAALALRGGSFHTCAVSISGALRCWGQAGDGRLGLPGVVGAIGDDELPSSVPPVDVGGLVVQATTGVAHTCARLSTGALRCFGSNASGQLGYGVPGSIGDDETPASVGDVPLPGPVAQVTAGFHHTCARLESGVVYCWGRGNDGRLGYGNTAWIGLSTTPGSVGPVSVGGGPVVQIEAGNAHTCARLDSGAVRCWGWGGQGQLGYGNTLSVGDDEVPAAAGDVPLGAPALWIAADGNHTCALLDTGALRCWGNGGDGRLGYGDTQTLGDDETPDEAGDVPFLL